MTRNGDHWTLSSGRRFYANGGIVGIAADGEASTGYDGGMELEGDWPPPPFTAEERQEIAAHAISLWTKWASEA